MRRNSKANFKEQRNKEVARYMYCMRQIDKFIKWTIETRGYLKMKHLKQQYEKYGLKWQE